MILPRPGETPPFALPAWSLVALLAVTPLAFTGCDPHAEGSEAHHQEQQKIVVTSPKVEEVTITQQYVCQIRSQRLVKIRALQSGYLEALNIKEGQPVKEGDVLFSVIPTLYKTRVAAEAAKLANAQLKFNNTSNLYNKQVVSIQEVNLAQTELNEAKAKLNQAETELAFTQVKAPFDGIIDRLEEQQGGLVKEGDVLTTLSDNTLMWVYFNVQEVRYLEYLSRKGATRTGSQLTMPGARIELILADENKFKDSHGSVITAGDTVTIEGTFNKETGNIQFRADFPNPDRILRNGQTGTVVIHQPLPGSVVIPQRAVFEILANQYVYVVGKDGVAKQRPIKVLHELEDSFVVRAGDLGPDDRIVLEGVSLVREKEGKKLEDVEYRKPEEVLRDQKHHAE